MYYKQLNLFSTFIYLNHYYHYFIFTLHPDSVLRLNDLMVLFCLNASLSLNSCILNKMIAILPPAVEINMECVCVWFDAELQSLSIGLASCLLSNFSSAQCLQIRKQVWQLQVLRE
ncbi:hypothetical protein QL285_079372 [Trifolium repens]|jgi:hypothetical protein|nr:hypothetical protein QL285_079372 [Trifolium repens]